MYIRAEVETLVAITAALLRVMPWLITGERISCSPLMVERQTVPANVSAG
jgi:hypothetical protein